MPEEMEQEQGPPQVDPPEQTPAPPREEPPPQEEPKREPPPPKPEEQQRKGGQQQQQRGPKPEGQQNRPPREGRGGGGDRPQGDRPQGNRPPGGGGGGDRGPRQGGGRPGGGGGFGFRSDGPMLDMDLEKLIADSLYLDNQAHAVVSRLRDMDSGTKSQLRRFYNAVRRACRTPENERQHEFVMLRARLAYTIARHSLRSMDVLEKLLLQVTRKNTAPGYERFRDLFEAIVAYNE